MVDVCRVCGRDYTIYGSDGICDACDFKEWLEKNGVQVDDKNGFFVFTRFMEEHGLKRLGLERGRNGGDTNAAD
ncbi:MAG: hypothetical protein M0R66_01140 [Candidatus Omnitrophica bacterium]|nr:hypothetical protein [Candidatus Omnitrophota bacterium]